MSISQTEQLLPHNLESERAVLGAVLLHQPALYEAGERLTGEEFYLEAHRKIWDAFISLQKAESAIDPITLKTELQRLGQLEACGGPAYVASLTDGIPRAIAVRHYADIVREDAGKRKLIQLGSEAMLRAYQGEESCKDILEDLQLALLKLSESNKKSNTWIKAPELVEKAYREIEEIAFRRTATVGLDTGFHDLNRMTQGFHRGELIIIAGRPGHGKTSLSTNILANGILRHGWRVGLFTIEMSAIEIMKRAIYSEAEVDSYRAGVGFLTKEDWNRLSQAAGILAETNLSVDDSGGLTIMQLRSRAQSLAIEGGLDLIVVDYLQLMSGTGKRNENRVAEISEISRGLKILAKDLNVPIIACSQLNRAIENDKNRKPILADLRESGSIEQDADTVLFIWREELRKRTEDNIGAAELIIGKQRNGPTGNIVLTFLPKITKFVDSTSQKELPECY
jgi:replicative DNA helicase